MAFLARWFKRKPSDNGNCLQRSATQVENDSSEEDEMEGPVSAPATGRAYPRRLEEEHHFSDRRAGGELRRSQTFGGRTEPKNANTSRISSSSCDSCSPDDQLRLRYSKVTPRHRGKMAVILQGLDRKTKRPVIIKAYAKHGMSASMKEKIEREQSALKAAASCSGIVKLLGTVEDVQNNYVVLESVAGQTLIEMMAGSGGRLHEARCVSEVVQPLCAAIASIHSLGIVHRDIKPEHIMCTPQGVKLLDFIHCAQRQQQCLNHRVGSLEYMAPEVLNKPSADEIFHQVLCKGMAENELAQYDEKVDIWSLGVVIFEALTGEQPFLAEDPAELQRLHQSLITDISDDGIPRRLRHPALSPLAQHFLAAALQVDPARRASAEQLLQHALIMQYTGKHSDPWLMHPSPTCVSDASSETSSYNTSHPNPSPPVRLSYEAVLTLQPAR